MSRPPAAEWQEQSIRKNPLASITASKPALEFNSNAGLEVSVYQMERIGLIAGRGSFPILFAQEAKKSGYAIMAVGVKAHTKRSLKDYVDKLRWIKVTDFKRIINIFKEENVSQVAMAGQINPYFLFNPKVMYHPDIQDFFGQLQDRRADTVFKAFAAQLQAAGFTILDSTSFLSAHMPKETVLTKRQPSQDEQKDIGLGFKLAKHLGVMDIGQSVCIKNGVILSVESIEGTDNAIRRASALAKSAIVLVKTSKPSQDMRFDVPVAGFATIKNLPKGSCLAIEAGKTLFLDKDKAIKLADKKAIAIIARGPEPN